MWPGAEQVDKRQKLRQTIKRQLIRGAPPLLQPYHRAEREQRQAARKETDGIDDADDAD